MRPPGETRWYSPARDITCFTPTAIRAALVAWEDPGNVYKQLGTNIRLFTDEDVCKVCEALAAFCSEECIVDPKTCVEAYELSGLADVPDHLRMVVMALIGEQFMAAFWVGIRGATSEDPAGSGNYEILQYDPQELAKAAADMCSLMRMPRWKWRLRLLKDRARRWILARLDKGEE